VKIHVGNLSFATTETEISEAFTRFGAVDSVQIPLDRETGASRGFAFVEMSEQGQAEQAIRSLNGADLGGRALAVSPAKPRTDRGGVRSGARF
jgi:RNA recognition motif-containing protein